MGRGNPDNLRLAAQRKREAAMKRAEKGLRELVRRGDPITFRGVAQIGGVSVDFLYRSTQLRRRIEHLRMQGRPPQPTSRGPETMIESSVVRTLTAEVKELRRAYREEIESLREALIAAHGEILRLRRRLGSAADGPESNG